MLIRIFYGHWYTFYIRPPVLPTLLDAYLDAHIQLLEFFCDQPYLVDLPERAQAYHLAV